MSDLSLQSEFASPENTSVVIPSSSKNLPPLHFTKASGRPNKFGKVNCKKKRPSNNLNTEIQLV